LDEASALKIIEDVRTSVSRWRNLANWYQLSKTEQELMSHVFEKQL